MSELEAYSSQTETPAGCTESCQTNSANSECENHSHEPERIDGAGEPCPAPLMWQEVRENYLRDSQLLEFTRGSHRLLVRVLGNGPPLYFVNNFAATAELFSLVTWLLKDSFRCVVYDTVTDSRHNARKTKPRMSDFSDDLLSIADQLGDRRFGIFGAGFGGAVALTAALAAPDRIDRVAVQHGFASRRLTFFERWLAWVCLRSGRTLDELPQRRRFQAVNHRPWFPPFDLNRFDFLIDSTGTLLLRDLGRRALAVNSLNIESELGKVACPVLMLRTEGEGRMAAESQEVLESNLRQVAVEWMHSAGQHPYLTHPHRIAKILKPFFLPPAE